MAPAWLVICQEHQTDSKFSPHPFGKENADARQKWQVVGFDPVYYKAHGMRQTRLTSREAKMWLRKGIQMISTHDKESEGTIFDKKVEIYPRFLLTVTA